MNPNINEEKVEPSAITTTNKTLHPVYVNTPLSRYFAMALFIVLPFVGAYVGYKLALSSPIKAEVAVETVSNLNIAVSTSTAASSTLYEIPISILNDPTLTLYSVIESKLHGAGRTFPTYSLYKKINDQNPVKFAKVGALNEYPTAFAVSPDKKKVAVNLETKLILIDVETGKQETLFTPHTKIGGRIAFSPNNLELAFVDGDVYQQDSFVTLYVIDVNTKKVTHSFKNSERIFVDVDAWRPDNLLLLSATAGKGCATPHYILYDLSKDKLSLEVVPEFGTRNSDGRYVIVPMKAETPIACVNVGNMCDNAYVSATQYQVLDPISKKILGNFGDETRRVEFIALKSDESTVLYKTTPMPSTEAQCEDRATGSIYYLKDFLTNKIELVSDLKTVLEEWGITLVTYDSEVEVLSPSYKIVN